LFADLVGFTALTDQEGDDRAADVALALYDRVRDLLPEYDAEELKTLGDGVALRCDDAANGIGLGVRLVTEIGSIPAFPPVRVGVHTGSAVQRQGEWYGRAVNVAARLCSAASGGEVLVSEQTCEAAGQLPRVEFGERRLHWLRNVTEPIAAHVASARGATAGLGSLLERVSPTSRRKLPDGRRSAHSRRRTGTEMSPMTRKQQQARTRTKLMRSASKLFCRHGLEQASVDEIAQDAGYTKGAFYSNFKSKEELFLAMLDEKFAEEIERIEAALHADETPDEATRHAGVDVIRFLRFDPEWERLFIEFVGYAGRNDGFRQELLTRCRAQEAQVARVYERWSETIGIEAPIPVADITRITAIMTQGFLLNQQIDPEVDDELYGPPASSTVPGAGSALRTARSRSRRP
jgi:adenylate cyclase